MGQSQLSHIVALLERCAKKRGWTHVNTQLLSSFFLFFNLTVTHKYTSKQRNNISPFVQFRQLKYFINDSSHEWKHFWQTYRTWDLHLGSTPPFTHEGLVWQRQQVEAVLWHFAGGETCVQADTALTLSVFPTPPLSNVSIDSPEGLDSSHMLRRAPKRFTSNI